MPSKYQGRRTRTLSAEATPLHVRCSKAERARWEAAARRANQKLSDWVRTWLDSASEA